MKDWMDACFGRKLEFIVVIGELFLDFEKSNFFLVEFVVWPFCFDISSE